MANGLTSLTWTSMCVGVLAHAVRPRLSSLFQGDCRAGGFLMWAEGLELQWGQKMARVRGLQTNATQGFYRAAHRLSFFLSFSFKIVKSKYTQNTLSSVGWLWLLHPG